MKKLLLLAFLLSYQIATAQVISIVPNSGTYGQTLTTTITLAAGTMTMASPPMQLNDIYLQQGSTVIFATNYTLFPNFPMPDSLSATFSIPVVTPPGLYDVHVTTYTCMGCPTPFPNDNMLTGGFLIGNVAGIIEGNVYYDANQNGVRDTNEIGLPNISIGVNPPGFSVLTGPNGDYSFATDTGVRNISVNIVSPFSQTTLPLIYTVSVPPDTLSNDFGLYAPPSALYTQTLFLYRNNMRCNASSALGWKIYNNTNLVESGSLTLNFSPNLVYQTSQIPPTNLSANEIRWDYVLQPFTALQSNVYFQVPAAGDTVYFNMIDSVLDAAGNFQRIYTDSYKTAVRCSYDPNDKSVSPEGEGGSHYTLKNSSFQYTIRFQNMGNDTAFNVLVMDTLDADLDISTFEVISSSHPVSVQIDQFRAVHFSFDNILLPDTFVDEPGSHGYVAYSIRAISSIADNTPVTNMANIYFDYNPAVPTNTTLNTMVTMIPVKIASIPDEGASYVYPNPLGGVSILKVPVNTMLELRIFDVAGREVINTNIVGDYILSKDKFAPGVYYYKLNGKDGAKYFGKFVVTD